MLFLPPSRNLSFGVNILSFFKSLEDNASAHPSDVPVDPSGRTLESSYSSVCLSEYRGEITAHARRIIT